MSTLNESIELSLPYTNAQMCYTRLELFPSIKQAFDTKIIPLATSAGELGERLSEIEAQRAKALDAYLEAGNSLREVDTALNCCIGDLYVALFDGIGFKVSEGTLPQHEKLALMEQLRAYLPSILEWNPAKRTELDILLQGTSAEIELEE